jgi:ABC-type antimicrobial peptide transport system permease subunit
VAKIATKTTLPFHNKQQKYEETIGKSFCKTVEIIWMNISALCQRAVLSKTKIYERKKTHNNMRPIKPKSKIFFKAVLASLLQRSSTRTLWKNESPGWTSLK